MTERTVPTAVQASLEDPVSTTALLAFVLIEHPNLAVPIRVVADAMDYLRDGLLWQGVLFGVTPPTDSEEAPQAVLTLPNTDRRIGEALQGLTVRPQVTLEICASSDFDLSLDPREPKGAVTPIYPAVRYEMVDIECTVAEISGRLMLRDYAQEPWPSTFATQSRLPGLFR
jgi:hypothetical protein